VEHRHELHSTTTSCGDPGRQEVFGHNGVRFRLASQLTEPATTAGWPAEPTTKLLEANSIDHASYIVGGFAICKQTKAREGVSSAIQVSVIGNSGGQLWPQ
jgi:hypothetical protein